MQKYIVVKTQFEGFHYWDSAPKEFTYLKNIHRHIFHVVALKKVHDSNREIEFIDFKKKITNYCRANFERYLFPLSCEQLAEQILLEFDLDRCQVMEDNENGAIVHKS